VEPLITACLIARDEEQTLARCLGSVSELVDEIVLVDTGSSDATARIASDFGAIVLHKPWTYDFACHRNQALELATARWCLQLDADEELVATDVRETRARLSADDGLPDILLVRMAVGYPGGRDATFVVPRIVRRSAGIRYRFAVHEQLSVSDAPALMSNVTLYHHGYVPEGALAVKEARNLAIAESMTVPSSHREHCIARSAFSLQRWPDVVAAATALMAQAAPPALEEEVCCLAAAACFNLRDAPGMERFVARALELGPGSSDARLVSLVAAAGQYLHALDHDAPGPSKIGLRPQVFWHDRRAAADLLAGLIAGLSSRGAPAQAHWKEGHS